MTVPPPPGDAQQSGSPPLKRANTVWLLGGLSAIVLIVVAAVVVILAGSGAGGDPAGERKTSAGKDTARYKLTDGVCEQIDLSGVPAEFNLTELESSTEGPFGCLIPGEPDVDRPILYFRVDLHDSRADAESTFKSLSGSGENPQPLEGAWDGAQVDLDPERNTGSASLHVYDGKLTMTVSINAPMHVDAGNEDAKKAVVTLATGLLAAAATG